MMIHPGYPQYFLDPYLENDRPGSGFALYPLLAHPGNGLSLSPAQKERTGWLMPPSWRPRPRFYLPTWVLQSRAFKLRFLSSARKGRFLQPQFPLERFLSQVTEENDRSFRICRIWKSPHFFGKPLSVRPSVWFMPPFFSRTGLSLTAWEIGHWAGPRNPIWKNYRLPGPEEFRQVQFLPVICPYCGADLQGEKDTQVLLCRNCDRAWDYSQDELKQMDFGTMEDRGNERPPYYLPFWRIRAGISGWPYQIPRPSGRQTWSRQSSDRKRRGLFIGCRPLNFLPPCS